MTDSAFVVQAATDDEFRQVAAAPVLVPLELVLVALPLLGSRARRWR
jgi:hypothetical protein